MGSPWEMTAETGDKDSALANRHRVGTEGKQRITEARESDRAYLFQGLVVHKAGSILGHLELALLDLLAELPRQRTMRQQTKQASLAQK